MHTQQVDWCLNIKKRFPNYFTNVKILDVGSLDVNGNNRHLFEQPYEYIGLDIEKGSNVDIACPCHLLDHPNGSYSVIISTNALEHDMYWRETLTNIKRLLASTGLVMLVSGTTMLAEHGTVNSTDSAASPLTTKLSGAWKHYYRNISETDIRSVWEIEQMFSWWSFEVITGCHICFFGVKK